MTPPATPGRRPAAGSDPDSAPPPVLGAWRNLYAVVVAVLVVVIALLWLLTRAFA